VNSCPHCGHVTCSGGCTRGMYRAFTAAALHFLHCLRRPPAPRASLPNSVSGLVSPQTVQVLLPSISRAPSTIPGVAGVVATAVTVQRGWWLCHPREVDAEVCGGADGLVRVVGAFAVGAVVPSDGAAGEWAAGQGGHAVIMRLTQADGRLLRGSGPAPFGGLGMVMTQGCHGEGRA
jgi:hypothetical protein